ncbi:hypothetical protein QQS21_002858 [Conoideocrella luteorostrata]|uniref:Uncharacterized protein n=1 Tax=Conoideocrella luteorostrata TaxID=1105319 RepID=A0AAJ0G116_9HYPO|nr:hypothetical protein QQS21_002858 [Conoideocrella luteorostrata]
MAAQKPRLVIMGSREYHIEDFVADFEKEFRFSVLDAQDRQEALQKLPQDVAENGPIDAFIIRIGTTEFEPFDEELLRPLVPGCKIIASASAGYNEFDVEWMTRNNIWFCNTLNAVAEATADMAMFLTLAVLRDSYRAERGARSGTWKAGLVPSGDPTNKTLGIIGMGSIGKYLARKASVFNMRIKYYNRRQLSPEEEATYDAAYCPTLEQLLSESDIVSVNCPLTEKTTNLISKNEFDLMKDGAFLVNTARGAIIDEDALIEALESGKITRAGLDVFYDEPHIKEYFKTSDKVICQPHMGAATTEAFRRGEKECLENIRSFFKSGRPVAPVNEIPE